MLQRLAACVHSVVCCLGCMCAGAVAAVAHIRAGGVTEQVDVTTAGRFFRMICRIFTVLVLNNTRWGHWRNHSS